MGQQQSLPVYEGLVASEFPKEGKQIPLKDGRVIGYEEYGNTKSAFIIFLIPGLFVEISDSKGLPGSRLFSHPSVQKAREEGREEELHFRLIVLERPGIGLSSPNPSGTFLTWVDDVVQVADHLKIEKFSLIGYSAGGPFALSCLYKIPERIRGAAIISSMTPNFPGATQGMTLSHKLAWWAAGNWKGLIRYVVNRTDANYLKDPVRGGRDTAKLSGPLDFEIYCNEPGVERMFVVSALELASRGQASTQVEEYSKWVRPWGYDLRDIRCGNVTIYNGTLDKGCTIGMAKYIASSIPNAKEHFGENKGHLFYFDVWDEVISTLKEAWEDPKDENKEDPKDNKEEEDDNSSSDGSKDVLEMEN